MALDLQICFVFAQRVVPSKVYGVGRELGSVNNRAKTGLMEYSNAELEREKLRSFLLWGLKRWVHG